MYLFLNPSPFFTTKNPPPPLLLLLILFRIIINVVAQRLGECWNVVRDTTLEKKIRADPKRNLVMLHIFSFLKRKRFFYEIVD